MYWTFEVQEEYKIDPFVNILTLKIKNFDIKNIKKSGGIFVVFLLQFVVVSGGGRAASNLSETHGAEFHAQNKSHLYGQGERLGLLLFHDLGCKFFLKILEMQ